MQTKITGHRGYSACWPENTMISFERAIEAGAERIEMDVHESSDGKLVVHHDYLVATETGPRPIPRLDWSALKCIDVAGNDDHELGPLRIPLLVDVLDEFGDRAEFEIELKGLTHRFVVNVVESVRSRDLLEQVEFTSSRREALMMVNAIDENAIRGIFVPRFEAWMSDEVGDDLTFGDMSLGNYNVAHLSADLVTTERVERFHARGYQIHAADCNTEAALLQAFRSGADRLSTDDVGLAVSVRSGLRG